MSTGKQLMVTMLSAALYGTHGAEVFADKIKSSQPQITIIDPVTGPNSGWGRTVTWLDENTPAWADLPRSIYVDIPAHMHGALIDTPLQTLSAGSIVKYQCPPGYVGCEAAVLLFECFPCLAAQGTLAKTLLANGWERTRCAPRFRTGQLGTGSLHPFSAYVIHMNPGTTLDFVVESDVEWSAFTLRRTSVVCESYSTAKSCLSAGSLSECKWDGDCSRKTCVDLGPSLKTCTICPWDETDSYL